MFQFMTSPGTNQPVAINPARVTKIMPDRSDPGLSIIFFASNDYVLVTGTLEEVVAQLND